jgi:peptidoglycan/xylan/chitin deacetylase (PgdA/CDA1 family)
VIFSIIFLFSQEILTTTMRRILFLVAICFILIFTNCRRERIGIAFTFDDSAIDEWYAHRSLFQKYDIHATFFITRPHLLDSNQIQKLKVLESEGHEIACHSFKHKRATDFETVEEYINEEIKPALQQLQDIGFNPTSFAYPFGVSTPDLDSALLNYFKIIRKATYNIQDTTIDQYSEIYANFDSFRVVNAMGVDYNFNISLENFETGILRALKNKEVLILYAHIINTSNGNYSIHPEYLEKLFLISQKHRIKSLTMNEMYNYFKSSTRFFKPSYLN